MLIRILYERLQLDELGDECELGAETGVSFTSFTGGDTHGIG